MHSPQLPLIDRIGSAVAAWRESPHPRWLFSRYVLFPLLLLLGYASILQGARSAGLSLSGWLSTPATTSDDRRVVGQATSRLVRDPGEMGGHRADSKGSEVPLHPGYASLLKEHPYPVSFQGKPVGTGTIDSRPSLWRCSIELMGESLLFAVVADDSGGYLQHQEKFTQQLRLVERMGRTYLEGLRVYDQFPRPHNYRELEGPLSIDVTPPQEFVQQLAVLMDALKSGGTITATMGEEVPVPITVQEVTDSWVKMAADFTETHNMVGDYIGTYGWSNDTVTLSLLQTAARVGPFGPKGSTAFPSQWSLALVRRKPVTLEQVTRGYGRTDTALKIVIEPARQPADQASPQAVATPFPESAQETGATREASVIPVPTPAAPPVTPSATPVPTSTSASRRTNLMMDPVAPTPVPTPNRAAHVARRASVEQIQRRTLAEFDKNSLDATGEPNFQAGEAALAEARLMEQRGDLSRAGIKLDEAEAAYKRAQETAKNAWK